MKRKPKVIITIVCGCAEVTRLPKGILLEIRDYDIHENVAINPATDKDGNIYEKRVFES